VISAGRTVEEYQAQRERVAAIRPDRCGVCGDTGWWHGNGWYERGVVWIGGSAQELEVRRLECQHCGHTTSLLPDFLHRHRHYGLAVIEQVVHARVGEGLSWRETTQRCSRESAPSLAPSLRTMRRWCGAFVQQALAWLTALLRALALVLPLLAALDAHAAAPSVARDVARQVLQFGPRLAAWLEPTNAEGWFVLWRWGWNAGIGRLV